MANFVTKEKAFELKDKGFDEPCSAYYRQILLSDQFIFHKYKDDKKYNNSEYKTSIHNYAAAPTVEEAETWERKFILS